MIKLWAKCPTYSGAGILFSIYSVYENDL